MFFFVNMPPKLFTEGPIAYNALARQTANQLSTANLRYGA